MDQKILKTKKGFLQKIDQAQTLAELDQIFLSLFGKGGQLDSLPKQFSKLSRDELKRIGPLFNKTKKELEDVIGKKRQAIREEGYQKLGQEKLDLSTKVAIKKRQGHLHPLTQFESEIADIFGKLGFTQFEAPQIDNDENNFQLLNIPEDHPARDLQDTLYLDTKNLGPNPDKLLLRTHTSNAQVRIMKENKPPVRLMNIGRCFRHENLDARHEHTFEQFELIYIDRGVNMANLQYLSEYFFQNVFGPEIKARLRPKYYPFVEPGAGVDGLCIFCKGKGCKVCGGVGWLELAGAGMIHPHVLKNGGIDPEVYSGIAWGVGPERMVMLKFGIEDIRLFKDGDLKFLKKF